jgi:hypothetical protein
MRVLVCGGRWFDNQPAMDAIMDRVHLEMGITSIIQGGQRFWVQRRQVFIGADYQAAQWAKSRGIECLEEPANWTLYGLSAGSIRNGVMVRRYKPAAGVAFPGGNGTADSVCKMRAAGIKVLEVTRELMENAVAAANSNARSAPGRQEVPYSKLPERDPA